MSKRKTLEQRPREHVKTLKNAYKQIICITNLVRTRIDFTHSVGYKNTQVTCVEMSLKLKQYIGSLTNDKACIFNLWAVRVTRIIHPLLHWPFLSAIFACLVLPFLLLLTAAHCVCARLLLFARILGSYALQKSRFNIIQTCPLITTTKNTYRIEFVINARAGYIYKEGYAVNTKRAIKEYTVKIRDYIFRYTINSLTHFSAK